MFSPEIVDLSHTLKPERQVYPGDPVFTCAPAAITIAKDGFNVRETSMGSHTGTHVDAPYHFYEEGKKVDDFHLDAFIGPALVMDLTEKQAKERIEWKDLVPHEKDMPEGAILLLYTGWSQHGESQKYYDHPFLVREAAEKIMSTGVRFVGIDALSPDENVLNNGEEGDWGAHQTILGIGGIIAENLTNLSSIRDGLSALYR